MDKCNVCHNPYRPDCDWNQGRCPHHAPLIDITNFLSWFTKKDTDGKETLDRTIPPQKDQ